MKEKMKKVLYRELKVNGMICMLLLTGLQALFLMLSMQVITFADIEYMYWLVTSDSLFYVIYNFLFFWVVLQGFFCVSKNITLGYVVFGAIVTVLSIINNMKWAHLRDCVTAADLIKLEEAMGVAGDVSVKVISGWPLLVYIFVILLWITVFCDIKIIRVWKEDKVQLRTYYKGYIVLLLILVVIMICGMKVAIKNKVINPKEPTETGPIIYFIESIFSTKEDSPYNLEEASYSYYSYVEQGKQIAGKTVKEAKTAVKPNVIVIMSESFYDVNKFAGVLSYSENPMKYYEEVQQKSVVSGNTKVNIYGGSTHFSEFEFLSGWNSKGMNSGSCPYKEYYNVEQPSFARYLQEQEYYTLAIHPYDGYFWNRENAYPNMGFDRFIDRSWMEYTDMCGYISDDALTNEIIYRYEERQDNEEEPFFCFCVSIANHVAMLNSEEFVNTANHIDITYNKDIGYDVDKKKRLKDYIGGVSKSGEALKKLTDYFEDSNEPTVIVFFGDHAPKYAIDILEVAGKEELSYETPYLIWSNYDIGEMTEEKEINVSYLSTYLIEILGLPLVEQNFYNIALHDEYSFETRYAIYNKAGKSYGEFSVKEQKQYNDRAFDIKKHIPVLLDNPETIENIWSVP